MPGLKNKTSLMYDLIMDEEIGLACITETRTTGEEGVNLQALCPPGFGVKHQLRLEGRGHSGLQKEHNACCETC